MVWDGMRPDFVSAELTPNLWRLAEEGVWFERSHAVYPTVTRANSPAISTGCRPGRAGIPGNTFCMQSNGALETFTSGNAANLERLAEADGGSILLVDTLADRVHRAGGSTVVVGTGSPGCTWLQHPRALDCGDLVIADGLPTLKQVMDAVKARWGTLPSNDTFPSTAWTSYFTRVVTEYVIPELNPTLLVFWHTDPDHTSHHRGHSAPETLRSLRDADDHLGAILEAYERLGLRSSTAFVVTSDHGGSTVSRRVHPARDLDSMLSNGRVAENGGSTFVYSRDPNAIAKVRSLDYVGPVFARDASSDTLPLSLIGLDGPRAPDIVLSLAWSDDEVDGVPGSTVSSSSRLRVDHGSISPHDLHNTLVAAGPDFRSGFRDPLPVGNIDICPTLTHLLGVDEGTACDGRVLTEALSANAAVALRPWQTIEQAVAFKARGRDWVQRVWFDQVGSASYLAGGSVEPA